MHEKYRKKHELIYIQQGGRKDSAIRFKTDHRNKGSAIYIRTQDPYTLCPMFTEIQCYILKV
jgi:hypothetical protein